MGRIVFSDVDGVLTDSKINIGPEGEIFKSFNVKDGYSIVQWRENNDNEFVIITGRGSNIVDNRASELGIEEVHQHVSDKKSKMEEITSRLGFNLESTVYIGDDFSDLEAMKTAETACCPANAAEEVQNECSYISQYNGGEGAVRDILTHLETDQ